MSKVPREVKKPINIHEDKNKRWVAKHIVGDHYGVFDIDISTPLKVTNKVEAETIADLANDLADQLNAVEDKDE